MMRPHFTRLPSPIFCPLYSYSVNNFILKNVESSYPLENVIFKQASLAYPSEVKRSFPIFHLLCFLSKRIKSCFKVICRK